MTRWTIERTPDVPDCRHPGCPKPGPYQAVGTQELELGDVVDGARATARHILEPLCYGHAQTVVREQEAADRPLGTDRRRR